MNATRWTGLVLIPLVLWVLLAGCSEDPTEASLGPVFGTVSQPEAFGVPNAVVLQGEKYEDSVPLSAKGAFAVGDVPSGRYRVTLEFHDGDQRSYESTVDIDSGERVLRIDLDDDETLQVEAVSETDAVPRGSSALTVLGVFADAAFPSEESLVQVRVLDAGAGLVFSGAIGNEGSAVAVAFLPPGMYTVEAEMTWDPRAGGHACEREVEVTSKPLLIQAVDQSGKCHIFDNSVGN